MFTCALQRVGPVRRGEIVFMLPNTVPNPVGMLAHPLSQGVGCSTAVLSFHGCNPFPGLLVVGLVPVPYRLLPFIFYLFA